MSLRKNFGLNKFCLSELLSLFLLAIMMPIWEYMRWVTVRETMLDSIGPLILWIFELMTSVRLSVCLLVSMLIITGVRGWRGPALVAVWLTQPFPQVFWFAVVNLAGSAGQRSWNDLAYRNIAGACILPVLLTICIALSYHRKRREAGDA
jgi:hypothetical protein